jgi:hypothetical protein
VLDFLKRKKDYEVIDNFLDKTDFLKIQKSFLDNMNCSWHMSDGISETGSSDGVYFIHFLFSDNKIQSHKYPDVFPVMEKAKIKHPERLLIFDPKKPHSSTNCTDKDYRSTINFNYFN